jgi:dTDP-4-dehydrorhamnose reductase
VEILVTGSYGQLGSEIKELENEFPQFNFIFTDIDKLDITNEDAVHSFLNKKKPDYIINCAAYTDVDKAEDDSGLAEKINMLAPKLLGKYSKKIGAKLIHISTDYVFDGNSNVPYSELDAVNPQGVYGKTKLLGELNCLKENSSTVVVRTSWLYSAHGNNFVKTMLRLGKERESLNVVCDQIGTPTYATDLARVILSIIETLVKSPGDFLSGVYHYSNEGTVSWYDFAKAIFDIENISCEVKPIVSSEFPTKAKRPHYSVLNKEKIRDNFKIKIPYWRDSLVKCLKKIEL